jgi:hypothetical protein
MWWHAAFLLFLISPHKSSARLFSEGGSYQLSEKVQSPDAAASADNYYPEPYFGSDDNNNEAVNNGDERRLAELVQQLQQWQNGQQNVMAEDEGSFLPVEEQPQQRLYDGVNQEHLSRFGEDLKNVAKLSQLSQDEVAENIKEAESQPLTAQKKGQSEFVEFVEPIQSQKLRSLESMEKRVPSAPMNNRRHGLNLISTSGNIVFVAFVTMCCVIAVVGVVGGTYYYRHGRKPNENTFDEFTRYSPAGPGRDKLRKGRNSPNFAENGDESLAYKAQLHHYQQTKQKIIGNEEGLSGALGGADVDASDKSDDEGEENNYSVYECPGLAPTGDIEVQNPNFEIKQQP